MSKKVFIGGPISHLTNEDGFDESFFKIHTMVIQILQRAGYQILSAHVVEEYGKNKIEPDEVIVNRDLNWIEDADLCVFLLPASDDEAIRTDGTFIELGYATAKCSKNICFWDSNKAIFYSPMFRGMTTKNVKIYDIENIKEVLENIE